VPTDKLEITVPADDRQWAELADFFLDVYGPGDARLWREFHGQPPFCQREWCRIIRQDGRIASHVCYVPRSMRIGCTVIRAGTIGYVATHPEYRGLGLAGHLMEYWTQEATRQGYHLAYIHGIPDFYERFGYRHALPMDGRDSALWLDTADLALPPTGLIVRPFRERDLPQLARLYQVDNQTRSGTLVRSEAYWRWLLAGLRAVEIIADGDLLVAQRSDGQLVGYAMLNPHDNARITLWETAADDREAMTALLHTTIQRAQHAGHHRLYMRLPLDHRFSTFCISHGAVVGGYSDGVYARILDIQGLFKALARELEARLARSPLAKWTGTLRLETDIGPVILTFSDGLLAPHAGTAPVRSARMGQSWLTRLVTGYHDIAALDRRPGNMIDREDWPLLRALFPKGCPYQWAADGGY
jgi:predicted acetyltransferase